MQSPSTPASESRVSDSGASKRPAPPDSEIAESENRRKDPKTSRACDTCKKKKIRCDGTCPCRNCNRRKITCTYDTKYGRGRPPTPPLSTATSGRPHSLGTSAPSVPASYTPLHTQLDDVFPETIGTRLHSRVSPEAEIDGQYFDPTSGLNFLHRAWRKLFTRKSELASDGPNDSDRNQSLTSAGDRPFYVDQSALNPSSLVPEPRITRELQNFYFETCVVTYRMFHRQTVEGWMEMFLKNREESGSSAPLLGPAKTAILLTILAIASLRKDKISGDINTSNEADALQRSDQLFCAAMKMTDDELGFPRLESAQARLIQVLYLLQTSRMNKGWYTFGNAFHITLSLGMHRRRDTARDTLSSRPVNYISSQCCKRTFWVAYIIDRYLSVVFGRPRLYQDEDINQEFPDSVNDEDMTPQGPSISEDTGDCHITSLIFHAKIARIIGAISRHVYSVNDIPKEDRLAAANELVQELHAWHNSLPSHLGTVQPSTLIPSFRRQAIALKLAYFHAIIHAKRPFLLGDGYTKDVSVGIEASKASLKLVDKMARDSELFHSFWWTHYVVFCALAVVYVWEIQQARHQITQDDSGSRHELFDLAERCRSHLQRATTGLSPSRRYNIILEELRLEAQGCQLSRHTTHDMQQEILSPVDNSTSGPGLSSQDRSMLNMTDTFLFTDWLALDSSTLFPLPDPDSVSPPWLPVAF